MGAPALLDGGIRLLLLSAATGCRAFANVDGLDAECDSPYVAVVRCCLASCSRACERSTTDSVREAAGRRERGGRHAGVDAVNGRPAVLRCARASAGEAAVDHPSAEQAASAASAYSLADGIIAARAARRGLSLCQPCPGTWMSWDARGLALADEAGGAVPGTPRGRRESIACASCRATRICSRRSLRMAFACSV